MQRIWSQPQLHDLTGRGCRGARRTPTDARRLPRWASCLQGCILYRAGCLLASSSMDYSMAGHEKRAHPVPFTTWMDGVQGQSPQPQWYAGHGGMPFHDALKRSVHPPFPPPHYASRHASTRSVPPYVPPAKKASSNPCLLPLSSNPPPPVPEGLPSYRPHSMQAHCPCPLQTSPSAGSSGRSCPRI